jgi:5-carboxymethyl-2-hydroxymuconate isomerase
LTPDLGWPGEADGRVYAEYRNVGRAIATVVSARLAKLHELQTIYGLTDLHDMLEIVMVDSHNQRVANQPKGRKP